MRIPTLSFTTPSDVPLPVPETAPPRAAPLAKHASQTQPPRKKVVIVGGGFGGIATAKGLAKAGVDITLIDRRNHHLFQPLLYQVATAGLSPADIAAPIRHVLRGQKNARVLMKEVQGVDTARQAVLLDDREIPYDYLVLATGSNTTYYGHPEWETHAPGLKSVEEATEIRKRVLSAFERAEIERDPAKRKALMTFAVVGGGATGVEVAGAIAELSRYTLVNDYRNIATEKAEVVLVNAGPALLGGFPDWMGERAERELRRLGVNVRHDTTVTDVTAGSLVTSKGAIPSMTKIWAAGQAASPAAKWLGAEADKSGRVKVDGFCRAPGFENVFVIGDTALHLKDGKALPGLAPVAKQQGDYVARLILALEKRMGSSLDSGQPHSNAISPIVHCQDLTPSLSKTEEWIKKYPKFSYKDKGNMLAIGRAFAVAQVGGIKSAGFLTWATWWLVHILYLTGFRNKAAVFAQWAWSYLSYQKGARLITHDKA